MSNLVDWALAAKVANKVAGNDPFARSYHYQSLPSDFSEFTAQAEELVAQTTGLRALSGEARAQVVDRPDWVNANIRSFQRLLRPLTDKLDPGLASGPLAPIAKRFTALEVGFLLGWMSTRVLGQYDLLVVEDEDPEDQDMVYYVGPNVLALEKKYAFPPREFRLWIALHEVTHRAQFTGVEWMRPHFLSLVRQVIDSVEPDPKRFIEALKRVVDDLQNRKNPLAEGGLPHLIASKQQRNVLDEIAGLMSLLEGHGDVTMDRAGTSLIPSAGRFGAVLHARRSRGGAGAWMQRLIGLEAKMNQYQQGEAFIEAVEASGGHNLFNRVWQTSANLPTIGEIREPHLWIDRVSPSGLLPQSISV